MRFSSKAIVFMAFFYSCQQGTLPPVDGSGGDPSPDKDREVSQEPEQPTPGKPRRPELQLWAVSPNLESIQANLLDIACIQCHGGKNSDADLDLTDLSLFVGGGNPPSPYRGKLIAPGDPTESMLYLIINTKNEKQRMPPTDVMAAALPQEVILAVKEWIISLKPEKSGEDGTDSPEGPSTCEPGEPGCEPDANCEADDPECAPVEACEPGEPGCDEPQECEEDDPECSAAEVCDDEDPECEDQSLFGAESNKFPENMSFERK